MNCKPGDLAIFVRSSAGNEGAIVRCIRLATEDELRNWQHTRWDGPVWLIDHPIPRVGPNNYPAPLAKDRNLRPIRDPGDDARDETLNWLKVPSTDRTTEIA